MRRKYNHIQNVADCCFINHRATSLRNAVYREASVVDEFYFEKHIDADSGAEVVSVSNPLYVLFNQERLEQLSPMAIQKWIDQMNHAGNSELKKIKEKLTDDQLVDLVRSRYIQHPADLQAYMEACNADMEKLQSDLAEAQKQAEMEVQQVQQAQQAQEVTNIQSQ